MEAKTAININVPENFKVMDDFEFLKIRELIRAALNIASDKMDEEDETAELLWPILQCASDIFNRYKETPDILYSIREAGKQAGRVEFINIQS